MKLLNKIDKFLAYISAGTIFLMMIWVFADVILRYFFNNPIVGTAEITGEYFMVLIVFLSLSYTHKLNGHVSVDLFHRKFSRGAKRVLGLFSNLLILAMFILLGIYNFQAGVESFENDIRSVGLLNYPIGPAFLVIVIGVLAISIRVLIDTIHILQNKKEFQ